MGVAYTRVGVTYERVGVSSARCFSTRIVSVYSDFLLTTRHASTILFVNHDHNFKPDFNCSPTRLARIDAANSRSSVLIIQNNYIRNYRRLVFIFSAPGIPRFELLRNTRDSDVLALPGNGVVATSGHMQPLGPGDVLYVRRETVAVNCGRSKTFVDIR